MGCSRSASRYAFIEAALAERRQNGPSTGDLRISSFDDLPIIAEAEWLYDGTVPVRIRVHSSPIYYGTGDYEDPTDIAEDRPGDFYILVYEEAGSPGSFRNAVRNLGSIDEVLATVERLFPGARWLTPLERNPA